MRKPQIVKVIYQNDPKLTLGQTITRSGSKFKVVAICDHANPCYTMKELLPQQPIQN